MRNQKFILITRPAEEARVFARKLRQEGFPTMIEPMLEIAPLVFKVPEIEAYQGLVFTSVNAVRALSAKMGARVQSITYPCYCVGNRTAKEVRAQGFAKALSAKGTANDLIDLIDKKVLEKIQPLLYVRGEHAAQPVDKMLKGIGFKVDSI